MELRRIVRSTITEAALVNNLGYSGLFTPLGLEENYIVNVLGFDRKLLIENRHSLVLNQQILHEHLLFEGWWSEAKDFIKQKAPEVWDKFKEKAMSPIEALKEFGSNVQGIATGLYAAVRDESILGAVKSHTATAARNLVDPMVKALLDLVEILENYGLKKISDWIGKFRSFIIKKRKEAMKNGGWKGLLSQLAVILGFKYIEEEFQITEKINKIVEGLKKPENIFKDEILAFFKGELDDAASEKIDEIKSQVLDFFKEQLDFVEVIKEKIVAFIGKLAGGAIESLAGPIAWVKQAISLFKGADFVASAIGPAISAGKGGKVSLGR